VYPEATPRRSAATARLDGAGRGLGGAGGREGSMGRTFAGAESRLLLWCCRCVVAGNKARHQAVTRGGSDFLCARARGNVLT
jgi:hypothetical protein